MHACMNRYTDAFTEQPLPTIVYVIGWRPTQNVNPRAKLPGSAIMLALDALVFETDAHFV
jgi:hypothetical protein